VAAPTNPQYVAHNTANVGFVLPSYTHAQTAGCPIDTWQNSASNNGAGNAVTAINTLLAPTLIGSERIVRPANNALHTSYTFYVKVMSSNGGANNYFGPYTLHVGCTPSSVSFTDNPSLITA
jgi:hypothetical protein